MQIATTAQTNRIGSWKYLLPEPSRPQEGQWTSRNQSLSEVRYHRCLWLKGSRLDSWFFPGDFSYQMIISLCERTEYWCPLPFFRFVVVIMHPRFIHRTLREVLQLCKIFLCFSKSNFLIYNILSCNYLVELEFKWK